MMNKEIKTAVNRVRRMERVFNNLLENKDRVFEDKELLRQYKSLVRYFEGGKWLQDYTVDEKGLFPHGLESGVLSQDGVYNLLTEIEEAN